MLMPNDALPAPSMTILVTAAMFAFCQFAGPSG
jgi:hypothetical protein